jgi:hypothetical protein
VGTGVWRHRADPHKVVRSKVWDWAVQLPNMLIDDAFWQNQLILQYLSRTPTPWLIDSEVGDLSGDLLGPAPALTYLRYNVRLEQAALSELGLVEFAPRAEALREMTDAANRFDLAAVGERAAAAGVKDEHFPPGFDLPAAAESE